MNLLRLLMTTYLSFKPFDRNDNFKWIKKKIGAQLILTLSLISKISNVIQFIFNFLKDYSENDIHTKHWLHTLVDATLQIRLKS